ncbi:MAG TPA: hypothetical protein VMX74_14950 [Pirellulales bacterium]|nr:hypothetical protein [Pirellulales bacterium]
MPRLGLFESLVWEPYTNNSSETVPAWGMIVITSAAVVTRSRLRHQCDRPGTTFYRDFAVNGPYAVLAGEKGDCTRTSPCPALYLSGTPALGETWGLKPAQFQLQKDFPGCIIDGIIRGEDTLAQVRLLPITQLIGKTTGAITGGTSSTTSYRIYSGVPFAGSDAGFTTVDAAYSKVNIDSGLWIKITYLNGYPVLEQLECNA